MREDWSVRQDLNLRPLLSRARETDPVWTVTGLVDTHLSGEFVNASIA